VSNLARNYLPPDYAELLDTINGASATYAGLSSQIQAAMAANAVLSNAQLSVLSPEMRQIVENGRRAAAMINTTSQSAYQNTSQRFAALQQLISMIGAAGDSKAIQDLQGRINAEQAMLTNEQSKLQTLYQIAQADQWTRHQQVREQVISGHGGFVSRFTPTP
jgi:type IV secretion system protein VirB5